jgi:PAS domain-containing protein
VEDKDGVWYLMRIMPYRTADNVIDGLVITFVDISRTKRAEAAAAEATAAEATAAERAAREVLQSTFDTFRIPALILDSDLRVEKANRAFCRAFVTTPDKTEGQLVYEVGGGEWDIDKLRELLEEIIPEKTTIEDFDVTADFPKIGERVFRLNARRLERETGLPGMILLTMTDVTGG